MRFGIKFDGNKICIKTFNDNEYIDLFLFLYDKAKSMTNHTSLAEQDFNTKFHQCTMGYISEIAVAAYMMKNNIPCDKILRNLKTNTSTDIDIALVRKDGFERPWCVDVKSRKKGYKNLMITNSQMGYFNGYVLTDYVGNKDGSHSVDIIGYIHKVDVMQNGEECETPHGKKTIVSREMLVPIDKFVDFCKNEIL